MRVICSTMDSPQKIFRPLWKARKRATSIITNRIYAANGICVSRCTHSTRHVMDDQWYIVVATSTISSRQLGKLPILQITRFILSIYSFSFLWNIMFSHFLRIENEWRIHALVSICVWVAVSQWACVSGYFYKNVSQYTTIRYDWVLAIAREMMESPDIRVGSIPQLRKFQEITMQSRKFQPSPWISYSIQSIHSHHSLTLRRSNSTMQYASFIFRASYSRLQWEWKAKLWNDEILWSNAGTTHPNRCMHQFNINAITELSDPLRAWM